MQSPYIFCGTPTPGLENWGLRTPESESSPKKPVLRFWLRAQNQTPTPTLELIVWHTVCVLKDDLREILNSSNKRCIRTLHRLKLHSTRVNVQSRTSTCTELESPSLKRESLTLTPGQNPDSGVLRLNTTANQNMMMTMIMMMMRLTSTVENVKIQSVKTEYLRSASEISSGKLFDGYDGGVKGELSIQHHLL